MNARNQLNCCSPIMSHAPNNLQLLRNQLLLLLQKSKTTGQVLQIHAQLITANLVRQPLAASRLLAFTASNISNMGYAELIYSQIDRPTAFMCNSMVIGYVKASNYIGAIHFYSEMKNEGFSGDNYTYPSLLKACGIILGLLEGRRLHGDITKTGFESHLFVVNGLISMYCRCGEISCARVLFDGFRGKDLVSWNSMVCGYVESGSMMEAQKLFDEMPERDVYSWSIMIDGYGKEIGDAGRARIFFDLMPTRDVVSWNSMIDVYAKVGNIVAARQVFNDMPGKTIVSWSIMIDGYAQHENPMEALTLFRQMLRQGMKPDKVSVVGVLMACGQLGALDQGRWIHLYMKKSKITMDVVVQTALVDMYMKCGSLDEARRMFNSMSKRNIISWNVMLVGLGMNGLGKDALAYFAQMEKEKVLMDDLIFLSILTACSQAGLVNEGLLIFDRMRGVYKIEPKVEHYGCLVDLFGRAGELDRALDVIERMPLKPNSALWGSILLACQTHRNTTLAEFIVDRLVELQAGDSGVYVLMSNIYANTGMWGRVQKLRNLIREKNIKKEVGRSVIEVNGCIEEFTTGKCPHIQGEEIGTVMESLIHTALLVR